MWGRKTKPTAACCAVSILQTARQGISGAGAPLQNLQETEAAFGGADFSDVRVHSDGNAVGAAQTLSAQAYAMGNAIAIRPELLNNSEVIRARREDQG